MSLNEQVCDRKQCQDWASEMVRELNSRGIINKPVGIHDVVAVGYVVMSLTRHIAKNLIDHPASQFVENSYPSVQRFLDRHFLQTMAEGGGSFGVLETCWHINRFTNDWITREMARACLRDLTDRGFCRYARGLFTEDGEVAGAGYGLTEKGLAYYDELCPKGEA